MVGVSLWLFAHSPGKPAPAARYELDGDHAAGTGRMAASPAGCVADTTGADAADACAAEAAVVRGLLEGTVTPLEYHRAMAELAARDAVSKPLGVPPDRPS